MNEKKRFIGLDYGLKRIGMALSDERRIIATVWRTLAADKKLERTVAIVIEECELIKKVQKCEIEAIVVGLPLLMNGRVGLLADEVHHFVEPLRKKISTPIFTWDERLTSVQADRALRESSLSRKRRAQLVDGMSAVIILQNYLDAGISKESNVLA